MKGIVNFNEDLGLFGRLANQDVSERDQQASREALLAFRQLVEQFPESKYAAEATTRINFITNTLAAYEIHVARYYYNRKAYVAAANRAQAAVAEFQYAPGIEEALYIMGESYDKLGLTQLRDDARRVLDKNFPNSAYASGGANRKKPWWQLW
jgi:outer membrane protein assembly factor BamD